MRSRYPLDVIPYPRQDPNLSRFPVQIKRCKNGRVILAATFAGMEKGQTVVVRMSSREDVAKVRHAANRARVRIKIEEYVELYAIRVTSLGPSRKLGETTTSLQPGPSLFRGWRRIEGLKPRSRTDVPDIFS